MGWVRAQRSSAAKSAVTLNNTQEKAKEFSKLVKGLENFRSSKNFVARFMQRNNLSYRKTTHRAQQNNKTNETKCIEVLNYLNRLNLVACQFESDLILNMDETPFYFDMMVDRAIDEKGAKSIEICHTGNEKARFTVVITITASGIMLPAYIIWKGKYWFKIKFTKK